MKIVQRHLPYDCHPNRKLQSIGGSVIHYISDRYRNPKDPYNVDLIYDSLREQRLSYHMLIPREGLPIELLPPKMEAWHAGLSRHAEWDYCNRWMHGIALVGMAGEDFTESQIVHLAQWLAQDMNENRYTTDFIVGHDVVRAAWNAAHPDKADKPKHDPGELFPWEQLREMLEGVDLMIRLEQERGGS